MAELNAKLFRDFFGGSWHATVYATPIGETKERLAREVVFNWPSPYGEKSCLGSPAGWIAPPGGGVQDDTPQVGMAGWRCDIKRWCDPWFNVYGGYGELQWTSQAVVNGKTVVYGFVHECKKEGDDPCDHIAKCEIIGQDNFVYTITSFLKGTLRITGKRLRTAEELNKILSAAGEAAKNGFADIVKLQDEFVQVGKRHSK